MPLYGSSFPLDGKGFVVTVVCPNQGSHSALMRALNNITPEAYEPGPPPPLTRSAALDELAAESQRLGLYDMTPPEIAVAAGEPATGGGASSQAMPLEPRLQGIRDPEQDDDTGDAYEVTPAFPSGVDRD